MSRLKSDQDAHGSDLFAFHCIAIISLHETQHLTVLSNQACIYVLPKSVAKLIKKDLLHRRVKPNRRDSERVFLYLRHMTKGSDYHPPGLPEAV